MFRRFGGSHWFLVFIFFGVLFWRVASLQIFPDSRVERQSRRQYWSRVSVSTDRGFIYDRSGNVLALSTPVPSFFIDPAYWNPADGPKLRGILPDAVVRAVSSPMTGRFFWIARKVDETTASNLRKLELKGIYEITEKKRLYPNKSLLAHVLGFCDVDDKGLSGIEMVWDKILFSPPGLRMLIKESSGKTLDVSRQSGAPSRGGPGSVKLSVDSRIQFIVEKRLAEGIAEHGAKWGTIICMHPDTGAVAAMASWPSFDLNLRESCKRKRYQYLGRNLYEPGSTLSPSFWPLPLRKDLWGRASPSTALIRSRWQTVIFRGKQVSYGKLTVRYSRKILKYGDGQIGMR